MTATPPKSKSRSSIKPGPTPPDDADAPVIFVDRALGKGVPLALAEAGFRVEAHDDHFPQDTEDPELLREIGRRGWLFFTKDKMMRKRTVEVEAIREVGLRVFMLASGNMKGEEMAAAAVKAAPKILRFGRQYQPPFISRVQRDGRVEKPEAVV
jgi:hypothetical protein